MYIVMFYMSGGPFNIKKSIPCPGFTISLHIYMYVGTCTPQPLYNTVCSNMICLLHNSVLAAPMAEWVRLPVFQRS